MTDRSIRRAAERKAVKAARKEARRSGTASPVSEAQLSANRANAQLARGAVTPEGKSISARNHTSHGLTALPTPDFKVLPGEDQNLFNAILAAFEADWTPANSTERELVHRLAVHTWLQSRALRLQNNILAETGEIRAVEERKEFALLMRYHAANARAFSKALSEIMRLKNFQRNQEKSQAILERRALDIQIRFESQKQKSELQAARLETIHLRQEAIKQRNRPSIPADVNVKKVGSHLEVLAPE
jgi:hypothetical protein